MDRDTVLPDQLLRRMLDVLDEARRDDTDDVPPRSVIRGLARLVPGIRCDFGELDWPTRRILISQNTDEDNNDVGFDPDIAVGFDPNEFGGCCTRTPAAVT